MLIYHLLLFGVMITAVFMFIQNRKLIKKSENLSDDNFELLKKINILSEENGKKTEEHELLIKKFDKLCAVNKEEEFYKEVEVDDSKYDYLSYSEFIAKCEEESERKRRNSELVFCVMAVSIDFYNEYQVLYKKIDLEELRKEIIVFFRQNLRKIDFIGKGNEQDTINVLLPMTAAEGAVIVASRLQDKIKDYELKLEKKKLIATLTIAICEAANSNNIQNVTDVLRNLKEAGNNSGGNTIRVEKI